MLLLAPALLLVFSLDAWAAASIHFRPSRSRMQLSPRNVTEAVTHIVGGSNGNSDIDGLYSPWGPWSRCQKRCRQVRMRRCLNPSRCGGAILKEERHCGGGKCKHRSPGGKTALSAAKSTSYKGMLNIHQFVFSEWSQWSSCSPTCMASRYKVCMFDLFCAGHVLHEEAFCYQEGSVCERLFKRRRNRSRKHNPDGLSPLPSNLEPDHRSPSPHCGTPSVPIAERNLRILGGQPAVRGRWPWMAAVLNRYREVFCGGTVLSPDWVLTAAHCVRRKLYVRVGENDLGATEGSEDEIRVSEVYIHPYYDPETVDNDVALLKLSSPARFGAYISAACLPRNGAPLPVDRKCVILGWGKERHTAAMGSEVLQEAQVPIVERDECLGVYDDYFISHNMFCAGYKRGRIDSCAGDSGGPLLCEVNQRWHVYGITSFGEGCGRKDKYGIYSRVPNYAHWIERIINEKR